MDEDDNRDVDDTDDADAAVSAPDVAGWEIDGELVTDLLQASSGKSSYSLASFADEWCPRAERSELLDEQLGDAADLIGFLVWAISVDGSADLLRHVSEIKAFAFDQNSQDARIQRCLESLDAAKDNLFGIDEHAAELVRGKLIHIFPDELRKLTVATVLDVLLQWTAPGSRLQTTGVFARLAFSVRAFGWRSLEQATKNTSEAVRKRRLVYPDLTKLRLK